MSNPTTGALPAPKQIRFVNNQGQPPSKRRRINAACLTCRKRKTRCAGEKPDCSTCKRNGHVCLGYTDIADRRREDRGDDEFMVLKSESQDGLDLRNDTRDTFLDNDEGDDRDQRRWANKIAPRTAGFVDQDALPKHELRPSATITPNHRHEAGSEWDQDSRSQGSGKALRHSNLAGTGSYSEDSRSTHNRSPIPLERRRVPYFRYFGPTAIVPGFKQMVVNVYRGSRHKSRGSSFSTSSPGSSLFGHTFRYNHTPQHDTILESLEDFPTYDVNNPGPVHPLIISLVETFFTQLGCNYRFLRKDRFLVMLKEKRIEPILVDAVCSLAARFSELPIFANTQDENLKRSEYGHVFAQRAKAAIVDTFPCPSVSAVQACLLMAYEGFGADQDSALWMYLGIAIRMAVDLGLQRMEGVKYQGERDAWYLRYRTRADLDGIDDPGSKHEEETLGPEEQRQVEQERIDTFWSVFILDRVISSGTGRPVTFRDGDYELSLPPPTIDPVYHRPDPFPPFIEIIHLYGRASDVLNNIRNAKDLTEDRLHKLRIMERDLTAIYQKQDDRLHFSAVNFREYVKAEQGTMFTLLHFWFHALVIILHQPTLLTPFHNLSPAQLLTNSPELPDSRELSMSSAKTIADILAFAELIDPKSLIGNPFTSQPIYIAACAFLMESVANTSQPASYEPSPTPDFRAEQFKPPPPVGKFGSSSDTRPVKHSLLASAANQNYQRCYKSLQQLEQYWGGVGYILTALDQKSKGIWDCETFTSEEYEAMKVAQQTPLSQLARFEYPASPNVPPIAYSLTGTTNSPNSNLTVLFQGNHNGQSGTHSMPPQPTSVPVSAATPPGNMIYDPIRQSLPETPPAFPPAYLQPNVSAVRYQPHPHRAHRVSQSPALSKSTLKFESPSPAGDLDPGNAQTSNSQAYGSRSNQNLPHHSSYHPGAPIQPAYNTIDQTRSHPSPSAESEMPQQPGPHGHIPGQGSSNHHSATAINNSNTNTNNNITAHNNNHNDYEADFAQSGLVSGSYSYMGPTPINDFITFNSQEVNFDMLGLPSTMMPPWLEILPGEVLGGLFEGGMVGSNQHHPME